MSEIQIPDALKDTVAQLEAGGAIILFAHLNESGGGFAMAPCRATIVFGAKGQKGQALWSAAGSLVDGKFVFVIGRQHPITDERWKQIQANGL